MDSSRKWREKYAPYTDDAAILKLSPEELETSKQLNALRKSIVKARTRREKTKKDQKKVKAFARSRDKIPTATLSGFTKIATQYEIRPSVRIKNTLLHINKPSLINPTEFLKKSMLGKEALEIERGEIL